jgi:glycosyltransferase involved in cell wall biosynthesis
MTMRGRTVLMTTDAVGGVWTYALELAGGLAAHGVQIALAVLGPAMSDAQREQAARSGVASVHEVAGALEWMADPWRDVDAAGRALLELADELRPDVVHLNGYAHAALRWSAPTVVVAHSDVLSWWRAVHGCSAPSEWWEYAQRVRRGLRAASAVVAPTRAVLTGMHWEYGPFAGRVVHNGRRSDWVPRRPKQPLILTAGRSWDVAKNVRALSDVATGVSWPICVAGDDAEDVASERRGLVQLGRMPFDELAPWFARASIYASPARYEPFGLAVLEAAMCGCALVLADIPTFRELWHDAAVFVRPRDHDALRDALCSLIRYAEDREDLGRAAAQRALRYGREAMVASYLSVYETVLDHARVAA